MAEFHWLRPGWLLTCLPLLLLTIGLLQSKLALQTWAKVCDVHLLQPLLVTRGRVRRGLAVTLLVASILCMIVALAGPTWIKNAVPTYQHMQPRLILLDLSPSMLAQDRTPDRLTRAKFKIHDLLMQADAGQFGLFVYTGESFVVSPLTDDAQTIDALLDSLTPDIMPVGGQRLDRALDEANQRLMDMGLSYGELLVFTAETPSPLAVDAAQNLAAHGYHVSVIPMLQDSKAFPLFTPLAKAGQGEMIPFTDTPQDIQRWLTLGHTSVPYQMNKKEDVPLWRDEGRWFLVPALLLFLPLFRRGWLERVCT